MSEKGALGPLVGGAGSASETYLKKLNEYIEQSMEWEVLDSKEVNEDKAASILGTLSSGC